jgi:hypothetical protein
MSEKATEWFGMRVTPSQKEKIERLAERKGLSQKAAVLEAVERELTENGDGAAQPGSALDQIADLVGVEPDSDVPTDLSTNPEHMEDYGSD